MIRHQLRRLALIGALAACTAFSPAPLLARAAFSNGTYTIAGGSYSIEVEQQGDSLVVVEPNKRSEYSRQPDGTYHFYNPNTDATYGIRVIDRQTIEAFKPFERGNVPTRLTRLGGAPAVVETELRPSAVAAESATVPPAVTEAGAIDRYGERAQHYLELTRSDPDNVQSWAACAAAALKRSMANPAEADAYAADTAKRLKTVLVDPATSPCEEILPPDLFREAAPGALTAEQEEQLRALNARAKARIEAEKIEAARREEERRVYEKGVAEAKAAAEQFERDRAAYQAELARTNAAKAAYEREMEEYRRKTGGGGD